MCMYTVMYAVADPDLLFKGGRGGGQCKKNCFSALLASVWSKNAVGGGGGGGQAPALDPPLTCMQWEYAFRPAATLLYALWHYHYVGVQFYP